MEFSSLNKSSRKVHDRSKLFVDWTSHKHWATRATYPERERFVQRTLIFPLMVDSPAPLMLNPMHRTHQ
ncbi:hypothetical protein BDR04DRAFT_1091592 [Suillus decipiens]|nr:hypothetical protein BDR04DRAFT_1091592 [Suillus decipiens]